MEVGLSVDRHAHGVLDVEHAEGNVAPLGVGRPDGALAATLDSGETLIVDQVVAATGYKVDIGRVPFLAAGNLLDQLTTRNGFPRLDEQFQTSVPGLFMTSMPAMQDFGPFWGFTIAAPVAAQIIGRQISL